MTDESRRTDTVRRRVEVTGEVQGVFYRDTCRREAAELGVAGWIRNRRDGSVEAVFQGRPAAVNALVAWARSGPPTARVDTVAVHDEEPEDLTGFTVR